MLMNYKEHGRTTRALVRICPMEWQVLTGAGESRRSSRFSGQIRVMQRPELVTTRRPAAATAAELEQHGTVRGRRRQRKESEKGPSGRPIYKANS